MNILLVDDDPTVRKLLAGVVRREGHSFMHAVDGQSALSLFREGGIDLVVSDVSMPVMSGIELTRRIRALPADPYPYLILQSAHDDRQVIVDGMAAGADDFVGKDELILELPLRLRVAARILAIQGELRERTAELARHNLRMAADLQAAVRVQATQIPTTAPHLPGLASAFAWRPCELLGGDGFGLHVVDGRLAFYILDVSGHGVASALLAMQVSRMLTVGQVPGSASLLTDSAGRLRDPTAVLQDLNRQFPMESNAMLYFTALVGIADPQARTLCLATTGHPGPVLLRGTEAEQIRLSGHPIGMMPDADFLSGTVTVPFLPGDRLHAFTDGTIEALAPSNDDFGLGRLSRCAMANRSLPLDEVHARLLGELDAWRGGKPQGDDITLLSLALG